MPKLKIQYSSSGTAKSEHKNIVSIETEIRPTED